MSEVGTMFVIIVDCFNVNENDKSKSLLYYTKRWAFHKNENSSDGNTEDNYSFCLPLANTIKWGKLLKSHWQDATIKLSGGT